ncbi:MarC family protein [Xanthobacter pseudotagetidis]|uniref:MarC family protein n=1 Tax=Xanthobacter pseudotagetidis TaxID=3119911 RepID=UPI00372761BE
MIEDLNLFATQIITLWVVLEPVSHLSMFLSVTGHLDKAERRKAAAIGLSFAGLILVVFAVVGRLLLEAMGISIIAFQIAGGLILLLFSLSMIFTDGSSHGPVEVDGDRTAASVAVYPLAIPVVAGPGAILSVVLFSDNNRGSLEAQLVTLAALVTMMVVLLIVFWLGDYIVRAIGKSGANLLRRVMGILLAALSVNLVLNALQIWLGLPPI